MGLVANTLYYGDCLEWLPQFPSESVDLIYLDPPFNSDQNYNLLFGNGKQETNGSQSAQVRAFADTWRWDDVASVRVDRLTRAAAHPAHKAIVGLRTTIGEGGMLAYLSYMGERLAEMPRLLKPTGSIYLHCDPTASHYIKVMMDGIFGHQNFQNDIIWKRTSAHSSAKRCGPVHDTILFYSVSDKFTWNAQYQPHDPAYVASHYGNISEDGRPYTHSDLTASGVRKGSSGQPWRGFDPASKGNHWKFTIGNLENLDAEGRIYWSKKKATAWPRYIRYLDEVKGTPLQDVWTDIHPLNAMASERLGYPTQKPLALLERIIRASTNPGDLVLDPFCGCGTAVVAAHKLNRQWAGIDISPFAIDLICNQRLSEYKVPTEGYPYDLAGARKLAREHPFKFEKWAVTRVPGIAPNDQQVGDGGIDGVGYLLAKPEDTTDQVLAQVKGGKYQLGQLRDFLGVMEREQAAMGLYTTVEPIRAAGARTEVTHKGFLTLGASQYPRAQLWSIEAYFNNSMPQLPALADPYTGKPVQGSLQMSL